MSIVIRASGSSPFITEGENGIITIRMESLTKVWDLTIDDDGAIVTTQVGGGDSGSPMGMLLALTYP